jgi:polar amino acid transport system permease protein
MNSRTFSWTDVLFLIEAARWTLLLSAIAFAGGGVIGLATALARTAPSRLLRSLASIYVEVIQGIPLLALLFLSYYGIGILGINVSPVLAASLALVLNAGAFLGETWRGCIEAVPRTQWEASASLALTRPQQLRYVILPQAVRLAVPPTVGLMVQIVKATSLASVIGFVELSRAGQMLNNATFKPFLVFAVVGAIYFACCYPLSKLSGRLERSGNGSRSPVKGL